MAAIEDVTIPVEDCSGDLIPEAAAQGLCPCQVERLLAQERRDGGRPPRHMLPRPGGELEDGPIIAGCPRVLSDPNHEAQAVVSPDHRVNGGAGRRQLLADIQTRDDVPVAEVQVSRRIVDEQFLHAAIPHANRADDRALLLPEHALVDGHEPLRAPRRLKRRRCNLIAHDAAH